MDVHTAGENRLPTGTKRWRCALCICEQHQACFYLPSLISGEHGFGVCLGKVPRLISSLRPTARTCALPSRTAPCRPPPCPTAHPVPYHAAAAFLVCGVCAVPPQGQGAHNSLANSAAWPICLAALSAGGLGCIHQAPVGGKNRRTFVLLEAVRALLRGPIAIIFVVASIGGSPLRQITFPIRKGHDNQSQARF